MTGMVCAVRRRLIEDNISGQIIPHDMFYLPLLSLSGFRGKAIDETLVSYRQHSSQLFGISNKRRNGQGAREIFQDHRRFLKKREVMYQEILRHARPNAVTICAQVNVKLLGQIHKNLKKRILFFEGKRLSLNERIDILFAYFNPSTLLLFSVRSIVAEFIILYNRR